MVPKAQINPSYLSTIVPASKHQQRRQTISLDICIMVTLTDYTMAGGPAPVFK